LGVGAVLDRAAGFRGFGAAFLVFVGREFFFAMEGWEYSTAV